MVAEYMMMLWDKAGLPSGVINMIHGGKDIVQGLCKHPLTKDCFSLAATKLANKLIKSWLIIQRKSLH